MDSPGVPAAAGSPTADLAGLLVIDKPEGPTSHDVVGRVRRVLGERRVGHAGTLDPLASGVIVVLVGVATRLSPYLTSDDKRYRATVHLGFATTTYDREGDPLAPPAPVPADAEDRLRETLDARLGRQPQTPPAYSAKKIDGERAHRLARRGEAVAPAPALVHLKAWNARLLIGDVATIDLHTSAGSTCAAWPMTSAPRSAAGPSRGAAADRQRRLPDRRGSALAGGLTRPPPA